MRPTMPWTPARHGRHRWPDQTLPARFLWHAVFASIREMVKSGSLHEEIYKQGLAYRRRARS
jgi:hypothetical protein